MTTPYAQYAPVPAYSELTRGDLRFIRRRARRIVKSMTRAYQAQDDDRWISHRINIPSGQVPTSQTPHIEIHFMRKNPDGILVTMAELIAELSVAKPSTKERLLVIQPVLTRKDLRNDIELDELRLDNKQTMGEILFTRVMDTGLLSDPAGDHASPDAASRHMASNDNAEHGLRRTFNQKTRRQWSRDEKFARMKFENLRRTFLSHKGHMFKTVAFDVNAESQTFRLTFHAKKAFEGRHMVMEGRYEIGPTDEKTKRPSGMALTVTKTSLQRNLKIEDSLRTIDLAIDNHHADAVDHIASLLIMTKALRPDTMAEFAERAKRDVRPGRGERKAQTRADRRSAQKLIRGYTP